MQYFLFEGIPDGEIWFCGSNTRENRINAKKLFVKTKSFNRRLGDKAFLFVSEANEICVSIGAILSGDGDPEEIIGNYLTAIGVKMKDSVLDEITFDCLDTCLLSSFRNDYIDNHDKVLEQFGLERLSGKFRRTVDFEEYFFRETDPASLLEKAETIPAKAALIDELDRIKAGKKRPSSVGHPVHYLVQTDNKTIRNGITDLLLRTLFHNGRLRNRRYCVLDFRPGQNESGEWIDSVYTSNEGGAVLVCFPDCGSSESDLADGRRETIEEVCKAAKKHRNKVLTVFCLPRECGKTKELFFENLENISIVELEEDFLSGENAERFLKALAKGNGIRTDKKLFAKLEKKEGYLAAELRALFDEWFDGKLRNDVYPQYKEMVPTKIKVAEAPPKGSSFDELNEMIGLENAKGVILRAVHYYKAQKLFADKGMKADHPAMHMVFTGNPGTAKTTVARLFAGIMRENGLLSRGHLVEVGRSELVGKYVGWTAQIVEKKFDEAHGGVLFIDEAYSLVDDRDGSFGDEAINAIVREMENRRAETVVIFAGYPDKMEQFLRKNPGLRSRIAFSIPFDDYDTDSLCRIAELIARRDGLNLTKEATEKLSGIFEAAKAEGDFGNGRFVRNVIEKAKMAQAERLLGMDYDSVTHRDVTTIRTEDIEPPVRAEEPKKQKIGF